MKEVRGAADSGSVADLVKNCRPLLTAFCYGDSQAWTGEALHTLGASRLSDLKSRSKSVLHTLAGLLTQGMVQEIYFRVVHVPKTL